MTIWNRPFFLGGFPTTGEGLRISIFVDREKMMCKPIKSFRSGLALATLALSLALHAAAAAGTFTNSTTGAATAGTPAGTIPPAMLRGAAATSAAGRSLVGTAAEPCMADTDCPATYFCGGSPTRVCAPCDRCACDVTSRTCHAHCDPALPDTAAAAGSGIFDPDAARRAAVYTAIAICVLAIFGFWIVFNTLYVVCFKRRAAKQQTPSSASSSVVSSYPSSDEPPTASDGDPFISLRLVVLDRAQRDATWNREIAQSRRLPIGVRVASVSSECAIMVKRVIETLKTSRLDHDIKVVAPGTLEFKLDSILSSGAVMLCDDTLGNRILYPSKRESDTKIITLFNEDENTSGGFSTVQGVNGVVHLCVEIDSEKHRKVRRELLVLSHIEQAATTTPPVGDFSSSSPGALRIWVSPQTDVGIDNELMAVKNLVALRYPFDALGLLLSALFFECGGIILFWSTDTGSQETTVVISVCAVLSVLSIAALDALRVSENQRIAASANSGEPTTATSCCTTKCAQKAQNIVKALKKMRNPPNRTVSLLYCNSPQKVTNTPK